MKSGEDAWRGLRILIATARPRLTWRALYTDPIPPLPMGSRISNSPMRVPAGRLDSLAPAASAPAASFSRQRGQAPENSSATREGATRVPQRGQAAGSVISLEGGEEVSQLLFGLALRSRRGPEHVEDRRGVAAPGGMESVAD